MGILLVIEPNDRREMFGSSSIREERGRGGGREAGSEGVGVEGMQEGYEGGADERGKGRKREGRKEEMKTLWHFMALGGGSVNDLVIMAVVMKTIRKGNLCFTGGICPALFGNDNAPIFIYTFLTKFCIPSIIFFIFIYHTM